MVKKKYKISTVNFGSVGSPARVLVEQYEMLYGKSRVSSMVRKAVLGYLSNRPEFMQWKEQSIVEEVEELGRKISYLAEQKKYLMNKLGETRCYKEGFL